MVNIIVITPKLHPLHHTNTTQFMMPKQQARQKIDALLEAAGWVIQNTNTFNRNASLGVAVCEFQLSSGSYDCLLFIDGKATGVIKAKRQGILFRFDRGVQYASQA